MALRQLIRTCHTAEQLAAVYDQYPRSGPMSSRLWARPSSPGGQRRLPRTCARVRAGPGGWLLKLLGFAACS